MKKLLPLLLSCLIFSGCGIFPEDTPPPAESLVGETYAPEEYGGAVQCAALNLPEVQGMLLFGEDLLLLSGQDRTTLALLDAKTLDTKASAVLSCRLTEADLTVSAEGSLCFYDARKQSLVLLDASLQLLRRIPLPSGIQGKPVLWENTVYYCTASQLRAWDLETGLHRRVKEMACDSQSLAAVLMNGAVLQCQVICAGERETWFLSAADGRLLHRIPGSCTMATCASGFYGTLSFGSCPLHLFGGSSPMLLIPRDLDAQCFFLPGQNAAVTASQGVLDYYDLTTGLRRHTLTISAPKAVIALEEDTVAILAEQLILWDVSPGSPTAVEDETLATYPYSPDTAGLAQCKALAQALGNAYGLTIRLGEDGVSTAPGEWHVEPEQLVPLIERQLERLDQELSRLPAEILSQTVSHFSSVNLCLVRSVRGSSCGSFFLKGRDAYLILPLGQSLYHGLFHAMEVHIWGSSHAFDQWDRQNPSGFQYDYDYAANLLRDSGVYLFQDHRAFVDTFSMSYPKEDRARIFEYAMKDGQQDLFRPVSMQEKLCTLCTGIREAYGLSAGPFPWEQFLQ